MDNLPLEFTETFNVTFLFFFTVTLETFFLPCFTVMVAFFKVFAVARFVSDDGRRDAGREKGIRRNPA